MEAKLNPSNFALLHYKVHPNRRDRFDRLSAGFFGRVAALPDLHDDGDDPIDMTDLFSPVTYFCGDLSRLNGLSERDFSSMRPIEDLCYNVGISDNYVDIGEVPIDIHGIGVYYPEPFGDDDYYTKITNAHQFQALTESDKPGVSFRKGIYLTDVTAEGDSVGFRLLRCSTNLDGSTENFRPVDSPIVEGTRALVRQSFTGAADVNHVLAQTYENTITQGREKKARIKRHSDKTKDMPGNGVIAFCSFYSPDLVEKAVKAADDDWCHKNGSVLTRLRFRLKAPGDSETTGNPETTPATDLPRMFEVILHPNSVFIIPLSTNRLYTHEIAPASVPVSHLPTRLGYVIRSSTTQAVYRDGQTRVVTGDGTSTEQLTGPSERDVQELRDFYRQENVSTERVHYGPVMYSLNKGDYMCPTL